MSRSLEIFINKNMLQNFMFLLNSGFIMKSNMYVTTTNNENWERISIFLD